MSGPLGSQHWMYATKGCGFDEEIPFSVRLDELAQSYMSRSVTSTGDRQKFTYSSWVRSQKASTSDDTLFAEATDINNRSSIHIRYSGYGDPGLNDGSLIGDHSPTNAASGTVASQYNPDYPSAIEFIEVSGGTTRARLVSNRNIGNDTASWFHVTISVDTTQATASDRIKMYINGVEETSFAVATYPAQNTSLQINLSGQTSTINTYQYDTTACGSVQLARSILVDGQSLDASKFGCFEEGVWLPKDYSGSFGTNGFELKYDTAADLGEDTSGNGNDMTTTNVTTNAQTPDTPTNTFGSWDFHTIITLPNNQAQAPIGSATWINWGPHEKQAANTEFRFKTTGYGDDNIKSTMAFPKTGKWYWEVYCKGGFLGGPGIHTKKHLYGRKEWFGYHGRNTAAFNGIILRLAFNATGTGSSPVGDLRGVGVNGATGASWGQDYGIPPLQDDRDGTGAGEQEAAYGIAVDMDNNTVTWTCQGNVISQAQNIAIEDGVQYMPCMQSYSHNYNAYPTFACINMGQDSSFNERKTRNYNTDANGIGDFRYTVPSGHLALCTANLPEEAMDPAINKDSPKNHFRAVTWTGDASSNRSIAVGFQPDFIWVKNRDATDSHQWYDAVRGRQERLRSNASGAEATQSASNHLVSFDANGITIGSNTNMNGSGNDFVGFFMKMAGSSSSNTDGTITSTVSANQTAGMSIVSWTGNGIANATVGHGLSQKPQFMIIKNRDQNHDWYIWSQMLPTGVQATLLQNDAPTLKTGYLSLNSTSPESITINGNISTLTASTMMLEVNSGGNNQNLNSSGDRFVAYVFHDVEGFSQSADYHAMSVNDNYWGTKSKATVGPAHYGTFINTGFRPAFVMIKSAESTSDWLVYDEARSGRNPVLETLEANSSGIERNTGGDPIEFLSNGFRLPANADLDMSNVTENFIYIAFASTSQKYATG